MLCLLLSSMLASSSVCSLGLGTMQSGNMGAGSGGGFGHFNPAFMQGGSQQLQQVVPDGPRKRFRVDESG